jgi:hypothetical protein
VGGVDGGVVSDERVACDKPEELSDGYRGVMVLSATAPGCEPATAMAGVPRLQGRCGCRCKLARLPRLWLWIISGCKSKGEPVGNHASISAEAGDNQVASAGVSAGALVQVPPVKAALSEHWRTKGPACRAVVTGTVTSICGSSEALGWSWVSASPRTAACPAGTCDAADLGASVSTSSATAGAPEGSARANTPASVAAEILWGELGWEVCPAKNSMRRTLVDSGLLEAPDVVLASTDMLQLLAVGVCMGVSIGGCTDVSTGSHACDMTVTELARLLVELPCDASVYTVAVGSSGDGARGHVSGACCGEQDALATSFAQVPPTRGTEGRARVNADGGPCEPILA